MFDALSDRLDRISTRLRSRGRLSDADLDEALGEIRTALLEADVELGVVRGFLDGVRTRLAGASLSKALSPGQQVIKAVHEELIETLGGEGLKITYASKPPTVILLAGLQGAGKTTTAAKLAKWFKQQGRNPMLVAADLQRPAAVEQLRVLGEQVGVPVFSEASDPVSVAAAGLAEAERLGRDVLIVDTAGRLSIDEALMDEVRRISGAVEPEYTFLVIDAMTGQDAVATAAAFHASLGLDGVIMTKLDGDARGGAALSVKGVVGKPIVFASTGEKIDDLEVFHPDRMADRILGMGDILSLIEQAEKTMDAAVVAKSAGRLLDGSFTLDDFLEQLGQVRKMGSMGGLLRLMPGMTKEMRQAADQIDDREIDRVEAIVKSMTTAERTDPTMIDGSRRRRIADGSGRSIQDVNQLLKQFREMQKMMKSMGGGGMPKGRGGMAKALMGRGGPDLGQLEAALGGQMPGGAGASGLPPELAAMSRGVSGDALGSPKGGSKNKKKKGGRVTPRKGR
ncbi:MAG: signal recognition particle protein [Actinomycetes bacterium]